MKRKFNKLMMTLAFISVGLLVGNCYVSLGKDPCQQQDENVTTCLVAAMQSSQTCYQNNPSNSSMCSSNVMMGILMCSALATDETCNEK